MKEDLRHQQTVSIRKTAMTAIGRRFRQLKLQVVTNAKTKSVVLRSSNTFAVELAVVEFAAPSLLC